ncbi:hypothetical protein FJ419_00490 [Mesorhizobium sp. B2-6-2]|nr:hypothetical protein FJ419_00490 [Mesorhizobium sp. B2-6-2]
MPPRETPLQMAERHVCQGEALITRQRALIDRLARDGHPTDEARKLLREFLEAQAEHVAHWQRLLNSN